MVGAGPRPRAGPASRRALPIPCLPRALRRVRPQEGATPLIVASKNGHLAAVERLIAARANVNAKNNVGPAAAALLTPTHLISLSHWSEFRD